jgi:hypothetical protein
MMHLGDHLRVWRGVYYHHGIYVDDERVVQFGGSIFDKPRAKIVEVSLEEFQRGGKAQVVDHARLTWLGLWHLPTAYAPERIVARARCLARTQPEGVYNLVGRNCETVALWCVCGMGESLQRQWVQAVSTLFGGACVLYVAGRVRRRAGIPPWISAIAGIRGASLVMYYVHNRRFYRDARTCAHA